MWVIFVSFSARWMKCLTDCDFGRRKAQIVDQLKAVRLNSLKLHNAWILWFWTFKEDIITNTSEMSYQKEMIIIS